MTVMYRFNREETACFTGHRMIPAADLPDIMLVTARAVAEAWSAGYRTFICGGARGFDTVAAQEVLRFRTVHPEISLVIAVPCSAQADRWPVKDKQIYRSVLEQADHVIVLSEIYYTGCMQSRNRFMVDNASLCLCYMTRFEGGTWSTVRYALHQGVMLKNLAMHDVLKEHSWNSIYTFRSASENVSIVRLSHFRRTAVRKMNTLKRLSKRQK